MIQLVAVERLCDTHEQSMECFCKPDFAHFTQHYLSSVHSNSLLLHAAQSMWCEKCAKSDLQKHSSNRYISTSTHP